jgi:hypothetical protein
LDENDEILITGKFQELWIQEDLKT